MNDVIPNELISNISLEDAQALRKQLSTKIQYIRKQKSLRMEVYIQAEYRDAVESARAWAFEKGLITRNTKWTFAKFCIINTTKMILNKVQEEKDQQILAEKSRVQPRTATNHQQPQDP